jgi:starch phosphorylase
MSDPLKQYECGPFRFRDADYYDRHLMLDHVVPMERATARDRFEALAYSLRDLVAQRWLKTQQTHDSANPKQVYYLSMEFLIGRSLVNNIINMGVQDAVETDLASDEGRDWRSLLEQESDAGLGNGGLGRLAACFIDSLATLQIPAIGYGLRYEYGIFHQDIVNGWQTERPDCWLRRPDPWEVVRHDEVATVSLNSSMKMRGGNITAMPNQPMNLLGIPFDRPVVGYGGKTINTLRLWGAASPDFFDFGEFSSGDFVGAVFDKVIAESLTRVLYPDDSTQRGRSLRFVQEYFLVACSLDDIIKRFFVRGNEWKDLPGKVAIQLNDTHPSMAVAELMRILLDKAGLDWEQAWDLTVRTLAYTNHTLLPEALEKWPVLLFERMLPRLLEIIYEINRRFLEDASRQFPNDAERLKRMSLIEEMPVRQVRMASLAIVGTHSTNGVAEIHTNLLKKTVVADFAEMYPKRFSNKTNGVTPRRWLLMANPCLADLITDAIGGAWITDLDQLAKLKPLAGDTAFRSFFRKATREAKVRFTDWLKKKTGQTVDPDSIFDCQIKRIHEYKRQLLNLLQIIVMMNRLHANPKSTMPPRTFFFAGKAAPAYHLAKHIIKLANNMAAVIDNDPVLKGRIKVLFLPDYNVTLAECLIPAADVSEQISTAGFEASGTSNMKFMMNGALTVGTRDGATIEMARAAGEENFFLFGLTAEQVAASRNWYSPYWHYEREPETRAALDLIISNHFSANERDIFVPITDALLKGGDHYMHLADLSEYVKTQTEVGELYRNQDEWSRKAILNVAASGYFSSDRTIRQYADEIWNAMPCPVN